jgi:hypothetical protein
MSALPPGSLRKNLLLCLAVAWAAVQSGAAPGAELSEAQQQGRALAAEILAGRPTESLAGSQAPEARERPGEAFKKQGVLQIRNAKRQSSTVHFAVRVTTTPTNWWTTYEVTNSPAGAFRLEICQGDAVPSQYRLAQATNGGLAQATARSLGEADMMLPFAGSEFWVADLGLEFLHWPEQRLLGQEKRRTLKCRLLESTNPAPRGYSRVITCVDIENGGIVVVEAYDEQGKKLKEFTPKAPKKVNGRWELEKMTIRNEQTGARATINFDLPKD